MKTLKSYVGKRKSSDPAFAKSYASGYEEFKTGVMLNIAREEAGLTQEQIAQKLNTKKQPFHVFYTSIERIVHLK